MSSSTEFSIDPRHNQEYILQQTEDVRKRSEEILRLTRDADQDASETFVCGPSAPIRRSVTDTVIPSSTSSHSRNEWRSGHFDDEDDDAKPAAVGPAMVVAADDEQATKHLEKLERDKARGQYATNTKGSATATIYKNDEEEDAKALAKMERSNAHQQQQGEGANQATEWNLQTKSNLILSLVAPDDQSEDFVQPSKRTISRPSTVVTLSEPGALVTVGNTEAIQMNSEKPTTLNRADRDSKAKAKIALKVRYSSERLTPSQSIQTNGTQGHQPPVAVSPEPSPVPAAADTADTSSITAIATASGTNQRPQGTKASSISSMSAPPTYLTRDDQAQPPPGALRVRGIVAADDDDGGGGDSAIFSVTDTSNYPVTTTLNTRASVKLATASPVEAVLVEDHDDEAAMRRERELEERERQIRERELELEKKLQEMQKPAVKAQVVVSMDTKSASSPAGRKKKKGFLGFFKKSPAGKKKKSTKPAKNYSFSSDVSSPDDGWSVGLINDVVAKQLGRSSLSSRASSSELGEKAQQRLGNEAYNRVPIFKADEILEGKHVGKCKNHVVSHLNSIKLDDLWAPLIVQEKPEAAEKQKELRKNIAFSFSQKNIGYCVKRVRSSLDTRRRDVAVMKLAYEASLLLDLSHENIVHIAGMSEGMLTYGRRNDQCCFTISELIEDNLFNCLTKTWPRKIRGPQFFLDRLNVATSLACALSYLHSKNIVYFDLKPENIGFDKNGTLKLHNFCAAYELKGCMEPYDATAFTSSPFVGTHPYVAPEVVLKRKSGLRSDVYGFAIILWEIMTLKEPFEGLMIHEYTRQVIQEQKRPKLKLDKKTPAQLNSLMAAGWQHEAFKRPCMKLVYEILLKFQEEYRCTVETKK